MFPDIHLHVSSLPFLFSEPFFMIVEFMLHGNLKSYLDKNRKVLIQQMLTGFGGGRGHVVSQRQLLEFARQVADGMAFLSSYEVGSRVSSISL